MTNLDSVLKSRDITLLTKVHIVRVMVFLVVTYSCESWTIKKAKHQRIYAFRLWCWKRLLRVPWTAGRSKAVNLKGNQPSIFFGRIGAEAEALVLWPPDVKSQLIGGKKKEPRFWERLKAKGERSSRG